MRERQATLLVEMAVVMVCSTVVLAIATWVLCALLHAGGTVERECRQRATVARLAEQFRQDAHAAVKLTPPAANRSVWIFELGPHKNVEYLLSEGKLVRCEQTAGELSGRQTFRLPADTLSHIELLAGRPAATARLSIRPDSSRTNGPRPPSITVEAVLAKDHRFEKR